MSITTHLETLEEKHARLDAMIAEESARPLPDFTYITTLKKQKLHIKEELARLDQYRRITAESQATAS